MPTATEAGDERVLVFAPTGRDSQLACQFLAQAGLPALACGTQGDLTAGIEHGAGAVVLAEEALQPQLIQGLRQVLGRQEPWSDLPFIVFARAAATSGATLESVEPLGNATVLERPVRIDTLIAAVRAALRARRRQYQVRDLLRRQTEADRRKDEFLALLGHELRNPLAAIRNSLWVLDEVGSGDDETSRPRAVIERQAAHLTRMVDDLLDVSRVTLGKVSLKRRPVDLAELATRCLNELGIAEQAAQRGLDLVVATEPTRVDGDAVRLEQVLCNLLQNAIKYTPRGTIALSVLPQGDQAVVRVRDDGVGIPGEMLPKIFDAFTQVESSLDRSQGGLGLGLPLVRSLVEMHGGTVTASSAGPGRGSEFVVRLPLAEGATAGRPEPAPRLAPRPATRERLAVLVVEDNPDGRESLSDLLKLWGHLVEQAETGHEGVEKALALRPDVALVDIGLPGLDGNEVARRVRATTNGSGPCLIAMTGYGQPQDRRRALASGFDAYLVKPVDPGVLRRLLGELTRGS